MNFVKACERCIRNLERLWIVIAAFTIFVIMLIATMDVALRYALNRPLTWAYDFVSLYLMAALFFLSISDTFRHDLHVRVDIITTRLPWPLRRALEILIQALVTTAFIGIFWEGIRHTFNSWVAQDVLATAIPWPTWAYRIFVPLGIGLLILRLLLNVATLLAGALTGRRAFDDIVTSPLEKQGLEEKTSS